MSSNLTHLIRFLSVASMVALSSLTATAAPKVILISLDGARPDLVQTYLNSGVLPSSQGLGLLKSKGVFALQNVTATPSLTAVSHIAIATGSTAVNNDIPGNTFHAVAQPIGNTTSGFGAPIGGYQFNPLGISPAPTSVPLWVTLRNAGKSVATATWPGGDGVNVTLFGTPGTPVVQPSSVRTVNYTVPFGAFGGIGAEGYVKTSADFAIDDGTIAGQLAAAGKPSYSPVKITSASSTPIFCVPAPNTAATPCGTAATATRTLRFTLKAAAIDTTNDAIVNYDTLVFYNDDAAGAKIPTGPFPLPATGPAYAEAGGPSAKFYLDGTGNKVGGAYFTTFMQPDLALVRFARISFNYIPRNTPVLADVDDVNNYVGFWAPQPDFRIPERLSPGFGPFPDAELEAVYEDLVKTFTAYQSKLALRAISRNPNADLLMIYFEQPDGSGHQFTLTNPLQPTNFLDPTSIGTPGNPIGATGQSPARLLAYDQYLKYAYQQANAAVHSIIKAVGLDAQGRPRSNIFVVSDHGMAPFHTAVSLSNLLLAGGLTPAELAATSVRLQTSGPSTNVYVNLVGREAGGIKTTTEYLDLQTKIVNVLTNAYDPNSNYNPAGTSNKLFTHVIARPTSCGFVGFCTNADIGQDFGDVFAMLREGYNFDGTQSPVILRLGDAGPAATTPYSLPNFYGAHGHDSSSPNMSAILFGAGPNLKTGITLQSTRNIDIAPTILQLLGVTPSPTVDGQALTQILQ